VGTCAHKATGLKLLAMKTTPIEKFQYLVHLKATNVHLFYRLLSQNIKVRRVTWRWKICD
jgi:hypothetical protein